MFVNFLLVGLGSCLGGILRYGIFLLSPFGALGNLICVNFLGSLAIGFFTSLFWSSSLRLFFIVGFLGSFTTFSSLSFEFFTLLKEEKYSFAFFYFIITFLLGIFGVLGGNLCAKWIGH